MATARHILLACALLCAASSARAQEAGASRPAAATSNEQLRLFLDCAASGCDFDFLRTELTWVSYVRDRTDAQVHVIATSLGTGSGGQEVTFKFLGLKDFAGVDDEVRFTTPQGASNDEQRRELVRVLKLGLARYVLRTADGRNLVLSYQAQSSATALVPGHDPWNFWVFSVGANARARGESQTKSSSWSASISARRTTELWKANFGFSGSADRDSYRLADDSVYKANTNDWHGSGLVVRSLGPHFSAGANLRAYSSTEENVDLNVHIAPAIEYDFFDYAEFTRRRLVASYSIGMDWYNYTEITVFDKTTEALASQALTLSYAARAPWGNANVGASASNHLGDAQKNRLSIFGGMSVRLVKGLQLSYNVSYSRVNDQISLPKGDATDEQVLLRLRQQATNYRANGYLSLSYTFGSVFNNVVNPRMGNSGGGGGELHF